MAWQTPKTNWTASDPIGTADLNRIEGNEAQLRTDLDAHTDATTGVHGATSAAMANAIVQRDSGAQAHFGAPTQATHAARKQDVDAVQSNLTNHIADYVRQPGFGVTGGSGNSFTVTLSPAPAAYVDGMGVVIRANRDNTGASTLNVNGLGARSIKRANGLDLAPGMLKNGGIYTLRYNNASGNFILQGEGSDLLPLYTPGVEHVPWVQGFIYATPNMSKTSDSLRIGLNEGVEHGTWVTDVPIDLTNIKAILLDTEEFGTATGSGFTYLIVSSDKTGDENIYDLRADVWIRGGGSFVSRSTVLDVSSLSGSYYIRIHREAGNTSPIDIDFRIYRVIASP